MITFSQVESLVKDIRYELDRFDRTFSDRGKIVERTKALMEPCYVHLWMIMYPIKGQEVTINSSIDDFADWILDIFSGCYKHKVTVMTVFESLSDHYLRKVKAELVNHHGYRDLVGLGGNDISYKMEEIFTKVNLDIIQGRKKSKTYMITKDQVKEIVKQSCEVK